MLGIKCFIKRIHGIRHEKHRTGTKKTQNRHTEKPFSSSKSHQKEQYLGILYKLIGILL